MALDDAAERAPQRVEDRLEAGRQRDEPALVALAVGSGHRADAAEDADGGDPVVEQGAARQGVGPPPESPTTPKRSSSSAWGVRWSTSSSMSAATSAMPAVAVVGGPADAGALDAHQPQRRGGWRPGDRPAGSGGGPLASRGTRGPAARRGRRTRRCRAGGRPPSTGRWSPDPGGSIRGTPRGGSRGKSAAAREVIMDICICSRSMPDGQGMDVVDSSPSTTPSPSTGSSPPSSPARPSSSRPRPSTAWRRLRSTSRCCSS